MNQRTTTRMRGTGGIFWHLQRSVPGLMGSSVNLPGAEKRDQQGAYPHSASPGEICYRIRPSTLHILRCRSLPNSNCVVQSSNTESLRCSITKPVTSTRGQTRDYSPIVALPIETQSQATHQNRPSLLLLHLGVLPNPSLSKHH